MPKGEDFTGMENSIPINKKEDESGECYLFFLNFNNSQIIFGDIDVTDKVTELKCKTFALFSSRRLFRDVVIKGGRVNCSNAAVSMYMFNGQMHDLWLQNVNFNISLFGQDNVSLFNSSDGTVENKWKKLEIENSVIVLNLTSYATSLTSLNGALGQNVSLLKMSNVNGSIYSYYRYNS